MKAYLAGPMSGLPDLNFPAFDRWARNLREQGIEIVNPAEINGGVPEIAAWADMSERERLLHWRMCMRADIPQLLNCEAIYMMPGWERSKGASLEHHIACALGFKVIYLVGERVAV